MEILNHPAAKMEDPGGDLSEGEQNWTHGKKPGFFAPKLGGA